MKKSKTLISVILILFLSTWFVGCKSDNKTKESLLASDFVKAAAKYFGWNIDKNTKLKGINKISLESTQAFDANYWGWDGCNNCFLENKNETRSQYFVVNSPAPTYHRSFYANGPFSDGKFPDQYADTGWMWPVPATNRIMTDYDKDGIVLKNGFSRYYTRWDASYDSSTGFPTEYMERSWDASTDEARPGFNIRVVKFSAASSGDPFKNYYISEVIQQDASGNNLWILKRSFSNVSKTTSNVSINCFAGNGTTPSTACDFYPYDIYRGSAASSVDTWTVNGNTGTDIMNYFNNSGDEYLRGIYTVTYSDPDLEHKSSETFKQYSVDTSTDQLTWAYQFDATYVNDFQVSNTNYSAENTISGTQIWKRDAQGRTTDYLVKDGSGDSIQHFVYTFDSAGRQVSINQYKFTAGVQDSTPDCNWGTGSAAFEYASNSYGGHSISEISYCNINTLSSTPVSKWIDHYNASGLIALSEGFDYDTATSTWKLSYKEEYQYDANGNRTKTQEYSVLNGVATAIGYYTYEYDANLFGVTTKTYDPSGDLSSSTSNINLKCTAGSTCYSTTTYTYR